MGPVATKKNNVGSRAAFCLLYKKNSFLAKSLTNLRSITHTGGVVGHTAADLPVRNKTRRACAHSVSDHRLRALDIAFPENSAMQTKQFLEFVLELLFLV